MVYLVSGQEVLSFFFSTVSPVGVEKRLCFQVVRLELLCFVLGFRFVSCLVYRWQVGDYNAIVTENALIVNR